ncbi:MAG: ClpXP protease specificity-enhancing factor [Burkholderiaceae bacterium]|nr:ClpXP protease specificity-enhancing factor [Burkholderiaceae bacterium]
MEPTSTKPYLIRAINEWCIDNGFTPYLAVSVDERTNVPREHVHDGEIVLNVAGSATNRLVFGNEWIEFQARFGGVSRELLVPVDRVSAIYSRESGHGMAFEVDDLAAIATGSDADDQPAPGAEGAQELRSVEPGSAPGKETDNGSGDEVPPPPRGRGKPKLTRIK